MLREARGRGIARADGTLEPFRHRLFLTIWIASFFNNFGTLVQLMAASWSMTTLTAAPYMVALVQTAATMPVFLLALIAGTLSDRIDRRQQMLGAQLIALAAGASLAGLAYAGQLTAWTLLLFTLLLGVSHALYLPAWQSSIGDMVPRHAVPAAVGLNSVSYNTCRATGPAVGGIFLAAWGAPTAFLFNAVTTLGIVAALLGWRNRAPKPAGPREPLVAAVRIGLSYALLDRYISATLLRCLLYSFFASSAYSFLPLIAEQSGSGIRGYAELLGMFGIGAVVAAASSVTLRRHFSIQAISAFGGWMTVVALLVVGLGFGRLATLGVLFLFGSGWVMTFSIFNSSVQLLAPPWLVGRVIAIYQMTVFAGLAFGSAFWGFCSTLVGVSATLAGAGVAMLVALTALRGRATLARDDSAPLEMRAYPLKPPSLEIPPSAGPILFEVGYEVDPENVPRFLDAVRDLGALRRRDGVRRWTLRRDLDAPNRWIESFWITNWAEQESRALRLTAESEAARERVAQVAVAETRKVQRYLVVRDKDGWR